MSKVNGQIVTCDACGGTVFAKCTGEGEADGGYTRWNNFERPEGWGHGYGSKDLCPSCTARFGEAVAQTARAIKEEAADDARPA